MGIGEFYAVLTGFVWAVSVIMFRAAGRSTPPRALNMFKNIVSFFLLLITFPLAGIEFFPASATPRDWLLLAASGVVGITAGDTLFFAGLNRLGAGLSAIVDCLYSPFVILFAFLTLGERLTPWDMVGAAMIVAAVAMSSSPKAAAGVSRKDLFSGLILGTLSMACMAAGVVMVKPILNNTDVLWSTTVRLAGGIAGLILFSVLKSERKNLKKIFTPSAVWKLTFPASVIGGYGGMILWLAGMKYAMASIVAVLNQLSAVFIVILAYFFLKEPLTMRKMLSVIIAVCGVAVLVFL